VVEGRLNRGRLGYPTPAPMTGQGCRCPFLPYKFRGEMRQKEDEKKKGKNRKK